MLSDLYLASDASRPRLRVGLLLDGPVVPAVFAQILIDIKRSQYAGLELAVFKKNSMALASPPRRGGWLRYISDHPTPVSLDYLQQGGSQIFRDAARRVVATHTYNRLGPFEVTDGLVWRPRSKVYGHKDGLAFSVPYTAIWNP